MKLKPLEDRIIVKIAEVKTRTDGGLYIPETAQTKTTNGVVTHVGSAVEGISVGDEIIYDKFAGAPIQFEKENYLILRYDDILVKMEAT